MVQFSVQSAQLSQGYDAFNVADPSRADDPNDPNWALVKGVFCEDVPDPNNPGDFLFPVWYPMHGGAPLRGQTKIFKLLKDLREASVNAQLLAVVDHGSTSITLDYTTGDLEAAHACADKVEFDESGLIKAFWHCSTNTHKHGHAGHAEGHDHTSPPSS